MGVMPPKLAAKLKNHNYAIVHVMGLRAMIDELTEHVERLTAEVREMRNANLPPEIEEDETV